MACIAAFLLAVLGVGREEDAFWTFVGLLENRVPASCVLEVIPLVLRLVCLMLHRGLGDAAPAESSLQFADGLA